MISNTALRNATSSRTLTCSWYSYVSRSPSLGSSMLTTPVTTSIRHPPARPVRMSWGQDEDGGRSPAGRGRGRQLADRGAGEGGVSPVGVRATAAACSACAHGMAAARPPGHCACRGGRTRRWWLAGRGAGCDSLAGARATSTACSACAQAAWCGGRAAIGPGARWWLLAYGCLPGQPPTAQS